VCIKQVPDTKRITGQAMNEDGTVNRAALPAIFNPEDLNALEAALQIREKYGGHVTVMTMGAPSAYGQLRDALYRGADEVLLLTDRRFAVADTLATSYTLAEAIRKRWLRYRALRPAGDRRRHGASRPADGAEARRAADCVRAGDSGAGRRQDSREENDRGRL
jgi:hypothetical protein